jgi:hypothetical protein
LSVGQPTQNPANALTIEVDSCSLSVAANGNVGGNPNEPDSTPTEGTEMNEDKTPKGTTWKRRRAGAIAGAALAALTMIGVASSGTAHAGPGWGGRVAQTTTTQAPVTANAPTMASAGWGG